MSSYVRRSSLGVALIVLLAFASAASAKTFVVTKKSDPNPGQCKANDCSLREAVIAANDHIGKDVISLPSSSSAYKLTRTPPADSDENQAEHGDLDLSDKTTVEHSGKGRATVDANGVDRAFDVQERSPSSFKKLVITGGDGVGAGPMPRPGQARGLEPLPSPEGGGIRNAANVRITSSVIKKNRSLSYGGGIGVVDDAGVTLIRSTVTRNTSGGNDGGGIDADNGKVVIKRSKITKNQAGGNGGAMYYNSDSPSSKIEDSTISGNSGTGGGGGLFLTSGNDNSLLKVDGSTISGNSTSNSGGGISVTNNSLTVTNSTVANNIAAAGGGGGISSTGVSGPRPGRRGGGQNSVKLNSVTVVGNKAGATSPIIQLLGGGLQDLGDTPSAFKVTNSLIALNFSGTTRNDCVGPFRSLGHNLLGVTSGGCSGFDGPGDLVKPNPKVGELAKNGGPTKTIELKSGSPAIGKAAKQSSPKRDQRGHKRDSNPDIGAFER